MADLWSVAVGGLIATVPVVFTTSVSHRQWLTDQRETRRHLTREPHERLITAKWDRYEALLATAQELSVILAQNTARAETTVGQRAGEDGVTTPAVSVPEPVPDALVERLTRSASAPALDAPDELAADIFPIQDGLVDYLWSLHRDGPAYVSDMPLDSDRLTSVREQMRSDTEEFAASLAAEKSLDVRPHWWRRNGAHRVRARDKGRDDFVGG